MRLNASIPALAAIAALAVLSVSSAFGLARPAHRHAQRASVAAPRHTAPAKRSSRRKAVVEPVKSVPSSRRRHAERSAPTARRVLGQVQQARQVRQVRQTRQARLEGPSRRHPLRRDLRARRLTARTLPPELTASAAAAAREKATSEDFLRAASGHPEITPRATAQSDLQPREIAHPELQAALAIHGTSRPEEPRSRIEEPRSQIEESRGRPGKPRSRRAASPSQSVSVLSVIRPAAAQKPQLPSVEQAASTPMILPTLYNKRGRLIVPPPLKGSHEILVHQNEVADRDGLQRIQNDQDLLGMRSRGFLVALPTSPAMQVDERLPDNRRFCRPWTGQFLATMARAHYAHFHTPLQVNSAVRTVEFQQHLVHINGNAAPAEGDTASPHLTGQAVDIAKHGLSLSEIAWMRGYLLPLVQEGKIDVEEEFQQSCFHISVYKRYLPSDRIPERDLASHRNGVPTLAAALR